jgi:hypothetical protein
LKFCMSNMGVVFHILCKILDLFWTVRGLTSKMPTYPICRLAPLSPISNFFNARMTFFLCFIKGKGKMYCKIRERIEKDNRQVQSRIDVM